MFYLILIVITVLHLGFGAHLRLLGGSELIVPTIIILTASQGWWRNWLIWLAVYGLLGYYDGFAPLILALTSVGSIVAALVFRRWIDHDTVWGGSLAVCVIVAGVIVTSYLAVTRTFSWAMAGSFLISLPLIIGWYLWIAARRGSS